MKQPETIVGNMPRINARLFKILLTVGQVPRKVGWPEKLQTISNGPPYLKRHSPSKYYSCEIITERKFVYNLRIAYKIRGSKLQTQVTPQIKLAKVLTARWTSQSMNGLS